MLTRDSSSTEIRSGGNYILALLFLINLVNYLDRFVLSSVLEPVKQELKIADDGDMGRLATAFLLGYFLSSPIFGYLGDRIPRKYLMVGGIVAWSIGTFLTGYARNYSDMIIYRVVVGLGEASFSAIGPAVISDSYSRESRNSAMTVYQVAVPVGAALGYLLGGVLSSTHGWRTAFLWTGLPGLLLASILLFLPLPRRGASDAGIHNSQGASLTDIKGLAFNRQYVLAVSGFVFFTFAMGAFSFWGPTFLTRVHHLTGRQASLFFAPALVIVGILSTVIGGWLATSWQKKRPDGYARLLSLSVAIGAPFSAASFLVSNPRLAMASMVVSLVFLFMVSGPINTVLMDCVPARIRASAMASAIFAIHAFGDLWSPELVGRIGDAFSDLRYGMLTLSCAFVVSAVFWGCLAMVQNTKIQSNEFSSD
ncbi:MAG: hypothetical protein RIR26_1238 [Pseudomonadota bacterium]|jgi:MFS family permease